MDWILNGHNPEWHNLEFKLISYLGAACLLLGKVGLFTKTMN